MVVVNTSVVDDVDLPSFSIFLHQRQCPLHHTLQIAFCVTSYHYGPFEEKCTTGIKYISMLSNILSLFLTFHPQKSVYGFMLFLSFDAFLE